MRPLLPSLALLVACGGGDREVAPIDGAPGDDAATCPRAQLEAAIRSRLDAGLTDPALTASQDVTVLLESSAGRRFTYTHGNSTPTTLYESASTSKLVTAAVILDLVEQGELALDTRASDLIDFWNDNAVTLRHLLAFTSGYVEEPLCINLPNANFENCVRTIYDDNVGARTTPGTVFHYGPTHMQVAGLMAMKATSSTWSEIFTAWRTRTGLFPTGAFDLPSATNPRLAAGMHWTGEEYLAFLRALDRETLLGDASRTELFANQRGVATVGESPPYAVVQEDWAYGLGNWLECPTATEPNSFDCGGGHRNSSAGAYGAYPFIDFDHAYFGIVAQQGPLVGAAFKGVQLLRSAQAEIEAWATLTCD